MPELPEVERAARMVERAVVGRHIAALRLLHPSLLKRTTADAIASVIGRRVTAVERRGKHQRLVLDDGSAVEVHFRMTGDWELIARGQDEPRFTRAVIELDDASRVALVDPRALGTLTVSSAGASGLPTLGPEPDDAAFDATYLRRALARRRGPIKPVLLDQRVVAGVGNIYAAEALWEARISPKAIASRLSVERLSRLVKAIRTVLRRSPAARYSDDAASARWRVYDREGKSCARRDGRIVRIVQAGRSTYFCPGCQKR